MQPPPTLNGRPTQAPLNREQQKIAYEALKSEYFKEKPAMPQMSQPIIREYKLSEAIPENLKYKLPTIEELERELEKKATEN
jgi:hypothetical protein